MATSDNKRKIVKRITEELLSEPDFKQVVEKIVEDHLRDAPYRQKIIDAINEQTSYHNLVDGITDKHLGHDTARDKLSRHIEASVKETMRNEFWRLKRFWIPVAISFLGGMVALADFLMRYVIN